MIHSLSFKNFYSFADEACISFVVNDKAPDSTSYVKSPLGYRLSLLECVMGPNASGKTNLLKALPFARWFFVESFDLPVDSKLPANPFFTKQKADLPTEFEVVFEAKNAIYTYTFSFTNDRILAERLVKKSKVTENFSSKLVFSREWSKSEKKYTYEFDKAPFPKEILDEVFRQNASFISTASRLNHEESKEIISYWDKLVTNVAETGWIGDQAFIAKQRSFVEALQFFMENKRLKELAEKYLASFDLGLKGFEIEKKIEDKNTFFRADFFHEVGDEDVSLPFHYESSGTKQLFSLLRYILSALDDGGIAVIDELDASLHPDMTVALFDLFARPETNPHHAQIIFSTHSARLLGKLDKYQIILCEKQPAGTSEAWRLDTVKGIRPDENYYAKYIAGAYGAIPNI